ncbi:MAG: Ig-like domain-containing protein [Christensenellales bacterium]
MKDIRTEFGLAYDSASENKELTGYNQILELDLAKLIAGEATIDLGSLTLPTIGLHASVELTMTSRNLKPGDADYDVSLAGWVQTLMSTLLDGTSLLGTFEKLTADEKDKTSESYYTGKTYNYNATDNVYEVVTGDTMGEYKFVMADLNITMASEPINLTIELNANVNLGPILAYGIGGILFSDAAIEIKAGDPINKTILSLYYLGSSRLMKKSGGKWELGSSTSEDSSFYTENSIYSDAIYIDATGLGLGKIKFQGIAGLLGATPSYGAPTNGEALTLENAEASQDATSAAGGALYMQVDIENGRIGLSFDNAFISTLLGMLGLDLPFELPDIQSVAVAINTTENGLDSINVNAILDSVGTGANVAISNVELGIGKSFIDSENLVETVKTGYAGLTFSKTSGIMSMIQNVLDNLKPGLNITINNKVWEGIATGKSQAEYAYSTITLPGRKVFTATNLAENSGYTDKGYKILLNLALDRDGGNYDVNLKVVVGGNNVFLTQLDPGGNLVSFLKIVPQVQDMLNCLDLGSLMPDMFPLQLTSATDGDDKTFEYPSAKTAADASSYGWNTDQTSYSYTADMSGLVKAVDVNLFNDYGYIPYYNGMGTVSNGAGKISLKITLNKDAYNELILMVNCILFNLLIRADEYDGEPWFINVDSLDNSSKAPGDVTLGQTTDAIRSFFNEFDALVRSGASTDAKVKFMEPYARSLPFTFIKWAVRVLAGDAIGMNIWGLLQNLGPGTVQNLSELIGGILPLPFASGVIDPSISIYIDLDPDPTEYGLTSAYTMNPGIQAIEIMVNGKKNGTGTSMLYNKAQTTDMSAMKFMKDGGGASNTTTTDVGQAWDFFMLRITPYSTVDTSFTTGLLQFDDSDSAENISGFEPPTEIVIEDPATRTGYAMLAGQKKDFQLRDSYFFDGNIFPQKAAVTFATLDEQGKPLSSYYPASPYKDATGTQIVWDAASVDLTAATSTDSEGRRLAGYVYGYVLNTVIYAIPVYVTNDFEMQSLKGYYRNADGTYSAKALALDIDKNSSKYMATLPDLVRLQFATGTYTFATYLTDSLGATQYAVISALSGAPKDSNGYQTLPQPTQAEIDAGASANLNADGNEYLIYPAYVAGLVKNADGSYKTFNVGDKTYYVLDRASLPTGKAFPTGTFSWDTADFKYDWQGSTKWESGDATNTIKVGYSYQWGLAKEVKSSIELSAKNYKISRLTGMTDENGTTVALKSERKEDGTYTTVFSIDSMSIDANTHDLVSYIKSFNTVNGKFATEGSMTGFDVEWDTTALEEAIEKITKGGVVNYYNGLEATIKAKVGGNRFEIATTVTKNGLTESSSGFVGQKQTFSGKLAQEVEVKVVVSSYVYDSIVDTLTFDPYSSKTITESSFGTRFKVNVKDFSGNKVEKTLTAGEGSNLRIEAPFINVGSSYLDAYNNGIYTIGENDITFEGYKHSKDYPLYAKLIIGTQFSGIQEVYVPIAMAEVKPSTLSVDVAHEDTFNPEWFASAEHESYEVSFGGSTTHVMYPDWSTIKYYSNAACTKLKAEQNIYEGGTIYAQVGAYVLDSNGDKLGLVFEGYDDKGNAVYRMQTITLRLNVEQQTIASVNFFYDENVGDVYAMSEQERLAIADKLADKAYYTGTVYAQSHVVGGTAYGVDPVSFAQNGENYFTVGEWGDAVNGTAVLVNLTKGTYSGKRYNADGTENPQGLYKKDVSSGSIVALTDGELGTSYIAYVQSWTTKISSIDASGIDMQTVWAKIGNNNVKVTVNIPDYTVASATFKNTTLSVLTDEESQQIGQVCGTDGNELSFVYSVVNGWALPNVATVTTAEGKSTFDTEVKWLDYSAPNKDEVKQDAYGKYVERKYCFYDGLSIRYPQADGFVAKIYLNGFADNVEVTLNGQSMSYDAFDSFTFASTATVVANGVTYDSVPVQWESTAMPTAQELKDGAFTRKAYVMSQGAFGEEGGWARDFTFVINNNFTLEDAISGFGGDFAGGFSYTLTSDNFYKGLPRKADVKVGTKTIAVDLAWSDAYTTAGFDGVMTLTLASEHLACSLDVAVTVGSAGIVSLASGTQFVLDPYAVESTLFASGTMQEVVVAGAGNQQVLATYSLADADASFATEQDFYSNVVKFFGKKIKLNVTYTYFGGADVMTETSEIEVYVADRTIMFISDYNYRSIIVDTFLNTDSSHLPTELDVTTILGGMNEHVFTAYFDWSGVDALIKSGKSNFAFVATSIVGVEHANGGYVYFDLDGNGKKEYVTIDKYVEFMKKATDNADFELTDEKTYMLAKQAVNVPVTVLDRTIADAELMLGETTLQLVYSDWSKYSTVTDTLVSVDRADGRYVDIIYDRASGMPKEYVIYNHMAYIGADALPSTIKLTFANGDTGNYRLTYDNAPSARDMNNLGSTLERTMTVHVWNTDPTHEGAFEVTDAFEMKIKLRVAKVTSANSNIAYNDMSTGDYRYQFDAYADSWADSVFNTANYANEITYYVDGQFILAQTWWTEGRSVDGGNVVTNATYDKRHANYVVYGNAFESDSQYAGVTFYTFNKNAKTYSKYTGEVNYDASATSYKDQDGNDLYIFIYVATQTLDVTWDASGADYSFKGGNTTVKANVASKVVGNSANANVNVVVHINDMRSASAEFGASDLNATTGKFFNADYNGFIIDPYTSEQIFDRVSGYDGNRYEKTSTAAGTTYVRNNLDGVYKLVDGEYVELTDAELDRKYVNFPSTITVTFADGSSKSLPITWDFSGVNVTYAGGEYTAQAIINYEGEYDFGKSGAADDKLNEVGVQKIKVAVKVLDRSAQSADSTTENQFKALVGYVDTTLTGDSKYVNPYDYKKPTMPTTIKLNVRKAEVAGGVQTDETEVRTYTTIEGNGDGLLVWSFDEFRPSYLGGVINMIAKLIDKDGTVQEYRVPFLVKKMLANKLAATNGTYTSTVSNGIAATKFSLNPYSTTSQTMPFAYNVTFDVYTPSYDKTTGEVSFATAATTTTFNFNYVIVSMPANTTYTISSSGITTSADGANATLQLGAQERITVTIEQVNKNVGVSSVSISQSGNTLPMSYTTGGVNMRVVWFGTAEVYDILGSKVATYAVMFSSVDSTFTLPASSDRKIVYRLVAAVGTVVDSNGTVVTTRKADANDVDDIGLGVVSVGQTIPQYQAKTDVFTIEI